MVVSILVSVTTYFLICLVFDIAFVSYGLVLSSGIPAIVSYPVSTIVINAYRKEEEARLELERLNALNNQLFSVLSHDIRGPVSSVHGILELLGMDLISKEEREEMIRDLSVKVDALLDLLQDVLEWTMHQRSNDQLDVQEFQVSEVWKQIEALYFYPAQKKSLKISIQPGAYTLFTNKSAYAFMCRNVFHNAIKFTPEHGYIQISFIEQENSLITIVKDGGVGMSPDQIHAIYHSDNWQSTPGTNAETGTGFGLKACIRYAHSLDGTIHIQSEAGKGTEVQIVLPMD